MRYNESKLQQACVKWFNYQHVELRGCLFSVPNGGARDSVTGRILKLEGVVAGVADLILLVPNKHYHALLIEMKTEKGRQSPSQREWQKKVESVGYKYVICRSLEQFIVEIEEYINKTK